MRLAAAVLRQSCSVVGRDLVGGLGGGAGVCGSFEWGVCGIKSSLCSQAMLKVIY